MMEGGIAVTGDKFWFFIAVAYASGVISIPKSIYGYRLVHL